MIQPLIKESTTIVIEKNGTVTGNPVDNMHVVSEDRKATGVNVRAHSPDARGWVEIYIPSAVIARMHNLMEIHNA